jgi:hypothetical protein
VGPAPQEQIAHGPADDVDGVLAGQRLGGRRSPQISEDVHSGIFAAG